MIDKYIPIGYTKKAYGSKGQVKIVIEDRFFEDFVRTDFVFINLMGKPAPYFIETIEEGADLLLKLEDINSPEEAKAIVAQEVFLREKDLSFPPVDLPGSDLEFADLIGFDLYDTDLGRIGTIKEIQEFPQQEMAVLDYNDREILLPLHPDLVADFDEKSKKITLRLPEGILEL